MRGSKRWLRERERYFGGVCEVRGCEVRGNVLKDEIKEGGGREGGMVCHESECEE